MIFVDVNFREKPGVFLSALSGLAVSADKQIKRVSLYVGKLENIASLLFRHEFDVKFVQNLIQKCEILRCLIKEMGKIRIGVTEEVVTKILNKLLKFLTKLFAENAVFTRKFALQRTKLCK